MDTYVTLNDTATYSELNGSVIFTLSEFNTLRVYDLAAIVEHLKSSNTLNRFLTDIPLDHEILNDLDVDSTVFELTQETPN
jgi:hypothetical protein